MAIGWVEKQCVWCGAGKGETVRCPNDVSMMVMDFIPCVECEAKHKGKVVIAEALAEDEITGRHVVLNREAADKMLIPAHAKYCLVDEESFAALFDNDAPRRN